MHLASQDFCTSVNNFGLNHGACVAFYESGNGANAATESLCHDTLVFFPGAFLNQGARIDYYNDTYGKG